MSSLFIQKVSLRLQNQILQPFSMRGLLWMAVFPLTHLLLMIKVQMFLGLVNILRMVNLYTRTVRMNLQEVLREAQLEGLLKEAHRDKILTVLSGVMN